MHFWALASLAVVGLFLLFQIYLKILAPLRKRSILKAQGVVFADSPFVAEVKAIGKAPEQRPFHSIFPTMLNELCGGKRLPDIMGACLPGQVILYVNSVALLDDFFIHQNQYLTKSQMCRDHFHFLTNDNVVTKDTFDKTYA